LLIFYSDDLLNRTRDWDGHHHQGIPQEHQAGGEPAAAAARAGAALADATHREPHAGGDSAKSGGVQD